MTKNSRYEIFNNNIVNRVVSPELTGTGSRQTIPHGLARTPIGVLIAVTDTVAGYTISEGTHDSTNIYVTVNSGVKYKILAFL